MPSTKEVPLDVSLFRFLESEIGRDRSLEILRPLAGVLSFFTNPEAELMKFKGIGDTGGKAIAAALSRATGLPVDGISRLSLAHPIIQLPWMGTRATELMLAKGLKHLAEAAWLNNCGLSQILSRRSERVIGVSGSRWNEVTALNCWLHANLEITRRIAEHFELRIRKHLPGCPTDFSEFLREEIRELLYKYLALKFVGEDALAADLEALVSYLPYVVPLCVKHGAPGHWVVVSA